jgi:uncharacterized protein YndB with AHSA1/START domain
MPAENARNHVVLTADVAGSPDAVFTYFTDSFSELWPGGYEVLKPGDDPNEPNGKGLERRIKPPGSAALEERIITHDRPSLIEYVVINDAPLSNHLGRIEFTPTASGTAVRYTIDFDYKPALLGPVVRTVLHTTWATVSRRKLRAAFPS